MSEIKNIIFDLGGVILNLDYSKTDHKHQYGRKTKLANTPPSKPKIKKDNKKVTIYFFILFEF